jgi:PKHD-type hydroxylase
MLLNGRSLLAVQYNPFHITVPHSFCDEVVKDGDLLDNAKAKIQDGNNANRSAKISWLNESYKLSTELNHFIYSANKLYNFSIKEFEPLQYTVYNEGDHYDWHIDTHSKPYKNDMIRKLSFTLCLNDEYEGGDFKICEPHPISDKTKVETFKLKKGDMIVFPSHTWHKVDKVIKGIRKSLVGWVVGNQWL